MLLVAHSLPIQADLKPQAGTSKNCERLGFHGTADLCELTAFSPMSSNAVATIPGLHDIER